MLKIVKIRLNLLKTAKFRKNSLKISRNETKFNGNCKKIDKICLKLLNFDESCSKLRKF